MQHKFDYDAIKEFIRDSSKETKVYMGADSVRYRKGGVWYAEYTVAIVVHRDGSRGCKIFGEVTHERDYDQNKNRPRMRLMNEVMKVAETYLQLAEVLEDHYCEVHLDINPNKKYGSSCVIDEAVGYIKGMCNITPKVKPEAFAASFCADRFTEVVQYKAAA